MKELQIDLFGDKVASVADAICITTNGVVKTKGFAVMGAGIAKTAAQWWPWLPATLGTLLLEKGNHVYILGETYEASGCQIVSFPTKQHWKNPSTLELIRQSTSELVWLTNREKWQEVFLPRPGCANGKLEWSQVRPVLKQLLDERFTVVHL